MKTIFRSFFIIAAVAAIAGVGTYSWFTSQASITGSTFSTGTLDLKVDDNSLGSVQHWVKTFAAPHDYLTNLKPGDDGEQIIDIKNEGTIDGVNATIQLNATAWSALGDYLIFTISYKAEEAGTWTPVTTGTLAQFQGNTYTLGDLAASKVGNVKIDWLVSTSAGNGVQGQSVIIDTVFGLEQVK